LGTRARVVLTVDEGSGPVFLRIARAIADDVRRGRLRSGDALPGTRVLAESLAVNRNTVVAAYRELVAEGWATTRRGGGTYVAESIPEPRPRRPRGVASALRPKAVPSAPSFALSPCDLPGLADPHPRGTLVMAGGVPDTRLLPADLFARALRRVLAARHGRAALAYGDPRGDRRLRAAVADLLRETRGVPARPDEVVVVRGSQMAFFLVARALVAAGGAMAVEALGYPSAWAAFAGAGARLVPIPVDARGIDVEALAAACRAQRIQAVCVTPHHQYPTTVTLAPGRRSALLELARRERFAIVEDDYDHELHYEGRPVMPLASADVYGSVVYVGSLSKVLAPGVRLGYVVGPRPVVDRIARERSVVDRQGDHASEQAAAELLEDGTLGRHVRRIRRVYMERRDHLVGLLRSAFGDRIEVHPPTGGMALWVRARLPAAKVVAWETRALTEGVAIVAGQRLSFDGRPVPYVRMGFAPLDEREAREAVARLERAFRLVQRAGPA
jgi:GntR family transcriptional regulator/MocR family aminotransferase